MKIPNSWTFKTEEIANEFDSHVREQLPWYDLATSAVAHFAKHFIPKNGVVYDIGASTGNIARALEDILKARNVTLIPVEESAEMAKQYEGPGKENLIVQDVIDCKIVEYDVAICFLTVMFMSPSARYKWLSEFFDKCRSGGALIIVDKIESKKGYIGTAFSRLTLSEKIKANVSKDEIIDKELSLAGIQRPIDPLKLPGEPIEFFRFADFIGWVIEKK
jgi:tRNA (cmo5U34)-methyltransferase